MASKNNGEIEKKNGQSDKAESTEDSIQKAKDWIKQTNNLMQEIDINIHSMAENFKRLTEDLAQLDHTPAAYRKLSGPLRRTEASLISLELSIEDAVSQSLGISPVMTELTQKAKGNAGLQIVVQELTSQVRANRVRFRGVSAVVKRMESLERTLSESLRSAAQETEEQNTRKFQNRIQLIGIIVTILVAIFTIAQTLHILGLL